MRGSSEVKPRPPPLLPSDRGSLGLAVHVCHRPCLAQQLGSRLSHLVSYFPPPSNGGEDGPVVPGVELLPEAKASTMFRYLH